MPKVSVSIKEIEQARRTLKNYLEPTPLILNRWLSSQLGCQVYLKLENMQPIGSFKIRGATYKISRLSAEEKKEGVVAASAGNHAQGTAWGAMQFKTKATIVMPKTAPLTKIQQTQGLRAEVILEGETYDEAYDVAKKLARKTEMTFVHPYEDSDVVAGQGTMGLEILEQLPEVDVVIGPMGGGGLMAGVGHAIKAIKPDTKLIGAQAAGACALVNSLNSGKAKPSKRVDTFADGIRVMHPSQEMVNLLEPVIDQTATIDDEGIASAILTLMEKGKVLSEGAGALPLAVLNLLAPALKKKRVVLIVTGGNIDVNVLSRIIDRGMILTGRRLRMNVFVKDKPGSLNQLTHLIAELGANVLQAIHDRSAPAVGLSETCVELTIETKGFEHSRELVQALRKYVVKIEVLH